MRLLIDTHILLWAIAEPDRIPRSMRVRLESPRNEVLFSAATIWEVTIKQQAGRLSLPVTPEELVTAALDMGFAELPVTAAHASRVSRLPLHHRDPFDRLLVSQAIAEPARFVTVDKVLSQYSELVELVS